MTTGMPTLCLIVALLSMPTRESKLSAQTDGSTGGNEACDLLTSADVEKVTGRQSRKPSERLADVQKTFSHCSFRDAKVRVSLLSKVSTAQKHVYQELEVGGFDKTKRAVTGVGDSAAIYLMPSGRTPAAFLVAHVGTRTLTIGIKMDSGQPSESAQPLAIGLAKIALAKLD